MWISASGIVIVLFLYVNPTISSCLVSVTQRLNIIEQHLNKLLRDNEQDRPVCRESDPKLPAYDQLLTSRIDEKVQHQNQMIEKLLENFENRLRTELKKIEVSITEVSQRVEPTARTINTGSVSASDIISKLDDTGARFGEKITQIESRLNAMALKNDEEAAMQAERLQTLLVKIDEKARTQNQNTESLIENFENRLKTRLEKIEDTISEDSQHVEPTKPTETRKSVSVSDIIAKLDDTKTHLLENIARIESRLNTTAIENQGEAIARAEFLQILTTKMDAKERSQNQNTETLIENSESRLTIQLKEIRDSITEVNRRVEPTEPETTTESVSVSDIVSKLDDMKAHCMEQAERIESILNSTAVKNEADQATMRAENLTTVYTEVQKINGKLENIESFLEIAQGAAPKAECKAVEPIVDIEAICKEQSRALTNVTKLVEVTLNHIQALPTKSEVRLLHYKTQEALQEAKYSLQSGIGDKINGVIHSVDKHNNETKISIDNLRSDLTTKADRMSQKLEVLENVQNVMTSTADGVLFIKNRLEYGIVEITSVVGNLSKIYGEMNNNLNNKIDKISNNVGNQSAALNNLKNETDEGLQQVWRQIDVKFQVMISDTQTRKDQLDQRIEDGVESTKSTIGGIASKVVDIQERISQVDRHLDNLLQQPVLVTQQINDIKSSLDKALSDIKAALRAKANHRHGPPPPPPYHDYDPLEPDYPF